MNDDLILKKLETLIDEGNKLKDKLESYKSSYINSNEGYYQNVVRWYGASYNLLKLRFGEDSDYTTDFSDMSNQKYTDEVKHCKENVSEAVGVLEYVYDALKNGLTDDLFYKQELIVLSDLLDQANEFFDKKLRLAAGIYGRVVLETTIREFAAKHDLNKKKFNDLIIELRKNEWITLPFEEALRGNYKIGSWAAHGKEEFNKLSDNQIKEYLSFIGDKVLTLE